MQTNIIKGDLFTISPNKIIRDRSYLSDIFRVVETTETQIWGKKTVCGYGGIANGVACFIKTEHDFHRVSEDTVENINLNREKSA